MPKYIDHSVLEEFLKTAKVNDRLEKVKKEFDTKEEFEEYKLGVIEGVKHLFVHHCDGNLEKALKWVKDQGYDYESWD